MSEQRRVTIRKGDITTTQPADYPVPGWNGWEVVEDDPPCLCGAYGPHGPCVVQGDTP